MQACQATLLVQRMMTSAQAVDHSPDRLVTEHLADETRQVLRACLCQLWADLPDASKAQRVIKIYASNLSEVLVQEGSRRL